GKHSAEDVSPPAPGLSPRPSSRATSVPRRSLSVASRPRPRPMCLPGSSSQRPGRGDRSSSSSPSAWPCGYCRRSPVSCCRCSSRCCWPRCSPLRPHGWSRRGCPAAGRRRSRSSASSSSCAASSVLSDRSARPGWPASAGTPSPAAPCLVKQGMPRGGAAAISFVGFIVVVLGLFGLVGQQIYSGMPDLVRQVIAGVSGISSWLATSPFGIDSSTISGYIDEGINTATNFFQNNSSQLLGGALEATSSVGTFLTGMAVCLFTTFFFLYDGENIFRWVMKLLPTPARP